MRSKFPCPHTSCQKSYVNSSILKRHIQAFHNDEKRFKCDTCGKCLASRQNLKEHIYIHSGEKPYKCPYQGCSATFRQGTHLSAHKKIRHEDLSEYQNIDLEAILNLTTNKLAFVLGCELERAPEIEKVPEGSFNLPLISEPKISNLPNIFIII